MVSKNQTMKKLSSGRLLPIISRVFFRKKKPDSSYNPIWPIAWVSFFWSVSSLMAFAVLPVFLKEELGSSHAQIGAIEGIAIAMSFFMKFASGITSDLLRRRKLLIIIGTLATTLSKPLLAIVATSMQAFWVRFLDRLGKGIRAAPTDALIADLSFRQNRISAFSHRQSLYALGAAVGAFTAFLLLYYGHDSYRDIFWLSTLPSLLALFVLMIFVREMPRLSSRQMKVRYHFREALLLPGRFWATLSMVCLLMLARFSEAFMTLKARENHWELAYLPLMIVAIDLCHAMTARYNWSISKRIGEGQAMMIGFLCLVLSDLIFAFGSGPMILILAIILNGIHMGMTQALIRAFLIDSAPAHLHGTAFALFYISSGLCVLVSNFFAGLLADHYGLWSTFLAGIVATCAAAVVWLLIIRSRKPTDGKPLSLWKPIFIRPEQSGRSSTI